MLPIHVTACIALVWLCSVTVVQQFEWWIIFTLISPSIVGCTDEAQFLSMVVSMLYDGAFVIQEWPVSSSTCYFDKPSGKHHSCYRHISNCTDDCSPVYIAKLQALWKWSDYSWMFVTIKGLDVVESSFGNVTDVSRKKVSNPNTFLIHKNFHPYNHGKKKVHLCKF